MPLGELLRHSQDDQPKDVVPLIPWDEIIRRNNRRAEKLVEDPAETDQVSLGTPNVNETNPA